MKNMLSLWGLSVVLGFLLVIMVGSFFPLLMTSDGMFFGIYLAMDVVLTIVVVYFMVTNAMSAWKKMSKAETEEDNLDQYVEAPVRFVKKKTDPSFGNYKG